MEDKLKYLKLTKRQVDDLIWLHYFLLSFPKPARPAMEWWVYHCAEYGMPDVYTRTETDVT